MAGLIDTINEHVEGWDEDCQVHVGCSCGWEPEGFGMYDVKEEHRQMWRAHLTNEVALAIRAIAHMAVPS